MTEPKKKTINQVNREIEQCKNSLNINQSFILSMMTQNKLPQSPEKPFARTQTDPWHVNTDDTGCFGGSGSKVVQGSSASPNKNGKSGAVEGNEILNYISNLKKLQGTQQEKSYILEIDYEKQRLNYESMIERLTKENQVLSDDLERKEREAIQKDDTIKVLNNQVKDLAHYRRENVEIKEDNKKYKADNKVIMSHIDRLTREIRTPEEKRQLMEEREMRVMKSLYLDSLPNIAQRQSEKQKNTMSNLTNKMALDDVTDRNCEMKSLIRRLNEQIQILQAEKALLMQQNKQKTLNLQNQKRISDLSSKTSEKLTDVIGKMGQKLMSLEQMNQTLRESLRQQQEGEDAEEDLYYYKQTKAKAGQFYYKR